MTAEAGGLLGGQSAGEGGVPCDPSHPRHPPGNLKPALPEQLAASAGVQPPGANKNGIKVPKMGLKYQKLGQVSQLVKGPPEMGHPRGSPRPQPVPTRPRGAQPHTPSFGVPPPRGAGGRWGAREHPRPHRAPKAGGGFLGSPPLSGARRCLVSPTPPGTEMRVPPPPFPIHSPDFGGYL